MNYKNIGWFFSGLFIALGLVYITLNYLSRGENAPQDIVSERKTLTGEYVCLPHRDTSGPQTMECAFGLKTAPDTYYALDTYVYSGDVFMNLSMGTRVTVEGLVTPVEMLSSDHWQKYNIKGIMSVASAEVE